MKDSTSVLAAFVGGVIAGAALALLLTPFDDSGMPYRQYPGMRCAGGPAEDSAPQLSGKEADHE